MTYHFTPLRLFGLALLLVSITGCSTLVPFTQTLRTAHNLSDDDLMRLQFYVSHEITLRKETQSKKVAVRDGDLRVVAGKIIDEIVIERHTPAVLVAVNQRRLRLSFEAGSMLDFKLQPVASEWQPVEPQPEHAYATPPAGFATPPDRSEKETKRVRQPSLSGAGVYFLATQDDGSGVTFLGKLWKPVNGSFRAHLLVDAQSLEEVVESRTVLKGRTL